jgi:hypothetical protein
MSALLVKSVHHRHNWIGRVCRRRAFSFSRAARFSPGGEARSGRSFGHPAGLSGGVRLVAGMVWLVPINPTASASNKSTSKLKPAAVSSLTSVIFRVI